MLIGVPTEIKDQDYRVGLTPASTQELTSRGHTKVVRSRAGAAIGLADEAYVATGATMCANASEIHSCARRRQTSQVRLDVRAGHAAHEAVATAQGYVYTRADGLLT